MSRSSRSLEKRDGGPPPPSREQSLNRPVNIFGIAIVEPGGKVLRREFNGRKIHLNQKQQNVLGKTLACRSGDRVYFDGMTVADAAASYQAGSFHFKIITRLLEGWATVLPTRAADTFTLTFSMPVKEQRNFQFPSTLWCDAIVAILKPAQHIFQTGDMVRYVAWDPSSAYGVYKTNELQIHKLSLPDMWYTGTTTIKCIGIVSRIISKDLTIIFTQALGHVLWRKGRHNKQQQIVVVGQRLCFVPVHSGKFSYSANETRAEAVGCDYVALHVEPTSKEIVSTPEIDTHATIAALKLGEREFVTVPEVESDTDTLEAELSSILLSTDDEAEIPSPSALCKHTQTTVETTTAATQTVQLAHSNISCQTAQLVTCHHSPSDSSVAARADTRVNATCQTERMLAERGLLNELLQDADIFAELVKKPALLHRIWTSDMMR